MAQLGLEKEVASPTATPLALGFWSAVLVTLFNVLSSLLMIPSWFLNPIIPWRGIESYASTFDFFQIASMLPGFLVMIPFLPLMTAIHYSTAPERRIWSALGIAFAAGWSLLKIVYFATSLWYLLQKDVRSLFAPPTLENLAAEPTVGA